MRRCVRSRNLVNEEALAHWGAVAANKKKLSSFDITFRGKDTERSFYRVPVHGNFIA